MGLKGTTTNYVLGKWTEGTRNIAETTPGLNDNWDKIDAQMKSNADDIATNASDIADHETRITDLEGAGGSAVDTTSNQTISGNKTMTGTFTAYNTVKPPQTYAPATDIATLTLSPARNFMVITPPSGGISALATINNGVNGFFLTILIDPTSADTITIKNGTGNIYLGNVAGDVTLYAGATLTLVCYSSKWYMVALSQKTYSMATLPVST